MLGEQDGRGLQSVPSAYCLADVLRVADEQLGRILDALAARGLTDRTLVVTADHGGQKDESSRPGRGVTARIWVATMAVPAGPDLVGLLADGFGFGRIGDHGGAQELGSRAGDHEVSASSRRRGCPGARATRVPGSRIPGF